MMHSRFTLSFAIVLIVLISGSATIAKESYPTVTNPGIDDVLLAGFDPHAFSQLIKKLQLHASDRQRMLQISSELDRLDAKHNQLWERMYVRLAGTDIPAEVLQEEKRLRTGVLPLALEALRTYRKRETNAYQALFARNNSNTVVSLNNITAQQALALDAIQPWYNFAEENRNNIQSRLDTLHVITLAHANRAGKLPLDLIDELKRFKNRQAKLEATYIVARNVWLDGRVSHEFDRVEEQFSISEIVAEQAEDLVRLVDEVDAQLLKPSQFSPEHHQLLKILSSRVHDTAQLAAGWAAEEVGILWQSRGSFLANGSDPGADDSELSALIQKRQHISRALISSLEERMQLISRLRPLVAERERIFAGVEPYINKNEDALFALKHLQERRDVTWKNIDSFYKLAYPLNDVSTSAERSVAAEWLGAELEATVSEERRLYEAEFSFLTDPFVEENDPRLNEFNSRWQNDLRRLGQSYNSWLKWKSGWDKQLARDQQLFEQLRMHMRQVNKLWERRVEIVLTSVSTDPNKDIVARFIREAVGQLKQEVSAYRKWEQISSGLNSKITSDPMLNALNNELGKEIWSQAQLGARAFPVMEKQLAWLRKIPWALDVAKDQGKPKIQRLLGLFKLSEAMGIPWELNRDGATLAARTWVGEKEFVLTNILNAQSMGLQQSNLPQSYQRNLIDNAISLILPAALAKQKEASTWTRAKTAGYKIGSSVWKDTVRDNGWIYVTMVGGGGLIGGIAGFVGGGGIAAYPGALAGAAAGGKLAIAAGVIDAGGGAVKGIVKAKTDDPYYHKKVDTYVDKGKFLLGMYNLGKGGYVLAKSGAAWANTKNIFKLRRMISSRESLKAAARHSKAYLKYIKRDLFKLNQKLARALSNPNFFTGDKAAKAAADTYNNAMTAIGEAGKGLAALVWGAKTSVTEASKLKRKSDEQARKAREAALQQALQQAQQHLVAAQTAAASAQAAVTRINSIASSVTQEVSLHVATLSTLITTLAPTVQAAQKACNSIPEASSIIDVAATTHNARSKLRTLQLQVAEIANSICKQAQTASTATGDNGKQGGNTIANLESRLTQLKGKIQQARTLISSTQKSVTQAVKLNEKRKKIQDDASTKLIAVKQAISRARTTVAQIETALSSAQQRITNAKALTSTASTKSKASLQSKAAGLGIASRYAKNSEFTTVIANLNKVVLLSSETINKAGGQLTKSSTAITLIQTKNLPAARQQLTTMENGFAGCDLLSLDHIVKLASNILKELGPLLTSMVNDEKRAAACITAAKAKPVEPSSKKDDEKSKSKAKQKCPEYDPNDPDCDPSAKQRSSLDKDDETKDEVSPDVMKLAKKFTDEQAGKKTGEEGSKTGEGEKISEGYTRGQKTDDQVGKGAGTDTASRIAQGAKHPDNQWQQWLKKGMPQKKGEGLLGGTDPRTGVTIGGAPPGPQPPTITKPGGPQPPGLTKPLVVPPTKPGVVTGKFAGEWKFNCSIKTTEDGRDISHLGMKSYGEEGRYELSLDTKGQLSGKFWNAYTATPMAGQGGAWMVWLATGTVNSNGVFNGRADCSLEHGPACAKEFTPWQLRGTIKTKPQLSGSGTITINTQTRSTIGTTRIYYTNCSGNWR